MKFKGENMSYSIDDLKKVLEKIKGDFERIILTEHYLQKLEHRCIDIALIDEKLFEGNPIAIERIYHFKDYFTLTFSSDGHDKISVVVEIFNFNSLIIISAVCGD